MPLVVPGVQATEHQTKALSDWKRPAVRHRERRVETELPEWLRTFTEGLAKGSLSSTDVSPADVERPPPTLPPSTHPPAKPTSNRAGEKHNLLTHFPRDQTCEVCRHTKVTWAPCKRTVDDRADTIKIAEKIGDMTTAGHKVLDEDQESRIHHRYAVVVQDLATQWLQRYPCKTKSAQETQTNLGQFLRPEENSRSIYTENSLDFIIACEQMNWNHERSTPHRSETKWNCRTSCTTCERRHFVSIGSVQTSRKLVGRNNGLLLLSPKCARPRSRWPDA